MEVAALLTKALASLSPHELYAETGIAPSRLKSSSESNISMERRHHVAHSKEWPWLPVQDLNVLAPHPFCVDCGLVKPIGKARAVDLGGLANLLSRMERELRAIGLKVTEAQRRLLMKRLEALDAGDAFGLSKESQIRMVAACAASVLGRSEDQLQSLLRSC
ncbi:MAG: hypothetical protein ACT4PT_00220 [Methanobacteriota archaeon]